jgi:hypothetical protein
MAFTISHTGRVTHKNNKNKGLSQNFKMGTGPMVGLRVYRNTIETSTSPNHGVGLAWKWSLHVFANKAAPKPMGLIVKL